MNPRSASGTARIERLSDGLCARVRAERGSFGRLLVIHRTLADWAGPASPGTKAPGFGLNLRMSGGRGRVREGAEARLESASADLPFVDDAFGKVTLYHVISNGEEPEMAEACRVLAEGGDLLIVGLNERGWAGFDSGNRPELPRLQAGRVRRWLEEHDMVLENRMGAGILGRERPESVQHGWRRAMLPVTDVVLLHARHRIRAQRVRPSLKNAPAGLAPTALAGR